MANKKKAAKKKTAKKKTATKGSSRNRSTAALATARLGGRPVSMRFVANAFSVADAAKSVAASLPPIPAVFPCRQGDHLHCMYQVANTIVAEAVLYLAPDENGDGVGDRLDLLGSSPSSQVSGTTAPLTAGWSYLIWDFHPADQNPWTAMLSISVNGGPAVIFGEASDNEASHHQAGMLIWAEPNA